LAAVLADGTNLGLARMADASHGISYHHLVNVAQWHVSDDNYVAARAAIVNAHHKHPMAAIWDDGTTASSDGQYFRAGGRAGAGGRRIFEEAASGGRWDRPELHRMLDQLREGDVVVVWKLDRLSRSLKDVLHIMERIGDAGAGFRSITEAIDTTTPAGRMMMQMVGSFAEFERAMIRERTSAGLAAARAEGRIGGRRKKLDPAKRREIAKSVISGRKTGAEMARLYNVSAPTVSRIVAQHRMVSL
jgi:DNA invertase Pin-like site-specific DNA recombinase